MIKGLPLDTISIENTIIMYQSQQYPLIIDPQNQASKYIVNSENARLEDKPFQVVKPGKNLGRILEMAVSMGSSVMIQNCGEQLDPVLDQLLLKNVQIS